MSKAPEAPENLTLENIKNLDADIIQAGKELFEAKARTETVKEIIIPLQKKVLKRHQFTAEKMREEGEETILNPDHTYRLSDEDFNTYLDDIHEEHHKAGFKCKRNYCPLLKAENEEVKASRKLIDSAEKLTGIKNEDVYKLDQRREYIDLLLSLIATQINK